MTYSLDFYSFGKKNYLFTLNSIVSENILFNLLNNIFN